MFWLARRSAHITRTLKSGVWEGLPQETSAKAVTAVICGLGNVMSSSRERGVSDSATVEAAMKVLEEKKLDSAGVYGQLMSNWENLKFSEGVCEELLEERGLSSLRADTVGAETVEERVAVAMVVPLPASSFLLFFCPALPVFLLLS